MNILGFDTSKIFKRSVDKTQYINNGKTGWLAQLLQWNATPVPVTASSSLGVAAYWRCVNLISQSIAGMPIRYYTGDTATRTEVIPAIRALRMPRKNLTSFTYNEILIGSALIYGNGYAYIERTRSGIELTPIHPDNIEPFIYDDEIFYRGKGLEMPLTSNEIIHLRGFGLDLEKGYSALDAHRKTLGLAIASQKENLNFYSKGTKIDGYLKMPGRMDQTTKDSLKKNWAANYGINGSGNGTAVLDDGMEYVRLGMPPADAKFIESSGYSNNEIATIFGVPAPMINQLERATHSNIEQLSIDFVRFCLMPWVQKLEQEYYTKLLTPQEQKGYFKYNVNALMRGDSKTRAEFYRIMLTSSVMKINEVRALEELDPIDGGDEVMLPLNMIPMGKSEAYYDKISEPTRTKENG